MELVITAEGTARMMYQEELDLSTLGQAYVKRASHVEPDDQGLWWADLKPVDGPTLGPFQRRNEAVRAEIDWIVGQLAKSLMLTIT